VPSRSRVETDGKYLIVYLEGSSGDAAKKIGSINVVASSTGQNAVTGVLSGRPCRVQFIQLENVAESSVVEAPGPSNQWARIVVRLRPKSSKRPVAFAINWTVLENASRMHVIDGVQALTTNKVRRAFQTRRRKSQVSGRVKITIEAEGNLVYAGVIDVPAILLSPPQTLSASGSISPQCEPGGR